MKEKIKVLYENTSSTMMQFEEIKNLINSISDKNILSIKLKEKLKQLANTTLADLLIFNDMLYQVLEAGDEIDLIFDELFSEGEDEY